VRQLRNEADRVPERVAAGETIVVTRDGALIAELRPLPRRGLEPRQLLERWHRLPTADPDRLRADIDAVAEASL
jgi:antitoxin (DNA-binding transcriptional repressor) of toxin-antitoxin stability system